MNKKQYLAAISGRKDLADTVAKIVAELYFDDGLDVWDEEMPWSADTVDNISRIIIDHELSPFCPAVEYACNVPFSVTLSGCSDRANGFYSKYKWSLMVCDRYLGGYAVSEESARTNARIKLSKYLNEWQSRKCLSSVAKAISGRTIRGRKEAINLILKSLVP